MIKKYAFALGMAGILGNAQSVYSAGINVTEDEERKGLRRSLALKKSIRSKNLFQNIRSTSQRRTVRPRSLSAGRNISAIRSLRRAAITERKKALIKAKRALIASKRVNQPQRKSINTRRQSISQTIFAQRNARVAARSLRNQALSSRLENLQAKRALRVAPRLHRNINLENQRVKNSRILLRKNFISPLTNVAYQDINSIVASCVSLIKKPENVETQYSSKPIVLNDVSNHKAESEVHSDILQEKYTSLKPLNMHDENMSNNIKESVSLVSVEELSGLSLISEKKEEDLLSLFENTQSLISNVLEEEIKEKTVMENKEERVLLVSVEELSAPSLINEVKDEKKEVILSLLENTQPLISNMLEEEIKEETVMENKDQGTPIFHFVNSIIPHVVDTIEQAQAEDIDIKQFSSSSIDNKEDQKTSSEIFFESEKPSVKKLLSSGIIEDKVDLSSLESKFETAALMLSEIKLEAKKIEEISRKFKQYYSPIHDREELNSSWESLQKVLQQSEIIAFSLVNLRHDIDDVQEDKVLYNTKLESLRDLLFKRKEEFTFLQSRFENLAPEKIQTSIGFENENITLSPFQELFEPKFALKNSFEIIQNPEDQAPTLEEMSTILGEITKGAKEAEEVSFELGNYYAPKHDREKMETQVRNIENLLKLSAQMEIDLIGLEKNGIENDAIQVEEFKNALLEANTALILAQTQFERFVPKEVLFELRETERTSPSSQSSTHETTPPSYETIYKELETLKLNLENIKEKTPAPDFYSETLTPELEQKKEALKEISASLEKERDHFDEVSFIIHKNKENFSKKKENTLNVQSNVLTELEDINSIAILLQELRENFNNFRYVNNEIKRIEHELSKREEPKEETRVNSFRLSSPPISSLKNEGEEISTSAFQTPLSNLLEKKEEISSNISSEVSGLSSSFFLKADEDEIYVNSDVPVISSSSSLNFVEDTIDSIKFKTVSTLEKALKAQQDLLNEVNWLQTLVKKVSYQIENIDEIKFGDVIREGVTCHNILHTYLSSLQKECGEELTAILPNRVEYDADLKTFIQKLPILLNVVTELKLDVNKFNDPVVETALSMAYVWTKKLSQEVFMPLGEGAK